VRETSCYGPHSATPGGIPNTNHNSYSRHKINTSLATTCDCSIEWRPSVQATTHTLTLVTHIIPSHNSRNVQCSSSISSHNSRDVIPSYNSRDAILSHNWSNVMCLCSIPSHNLRDVIMSHNSRNGLVKSILKVSLKAF